MKNNIIYSNKLQLLTEIQSLDMGQTKTECGGVKHVYECPTLLKPGMVVHQVKRTLTQIDKKQKTN